MTAGLHVGDCQAGVQAGMKGIHGHAVDLAREIEKHAGRGEILVSATVRNLVTGSGISFRRKGLLGPSASEVFSVMTAEDSMVQRIGA
jgi:class 3 adenylate cyclase